jgi:hypothetical protein
MVDDRPRPSVTVDGETIHFFEGSAESLPSKYLYLQSTMLWVKTPTGILIFVHDLPVEEEEVGNVREEVESPRRDQDRLVGGDAEGIPNSPSSEVAGGEAKESSGDIISQKSAEAELADSANISQGPSPSPSQSQSPGPSPSPSQPSQSQSSHKRNGEEYWQTELFNGRVVAKEALPFLSVDCFGASPHAEQADHCSNIRMLQFANVASGTSYQRGSIIAAITEIVRDALPEGHALKDFTNIFTDGQAILLILKKLEEKEGVDLQTLMKILQHVITESQISHGKSKNRLGHTFYEGVHRFPVALFLKGGQITTGSSLRPERSINTLGNALNQGCS